jgi:hypothetical protein
MPKDDFRTGRRRLFQMVRPIHELGGIVFESFPPSNQNHGASRAREAWVNQVCPQKSRSVGSVMPE